jgi:hypothetical protein
MVPWVGRRAKGSDHEIFTGPIYFVFKFQKRINLSHLIYLGMQEIDSAQVRWMMVTLQVARAWDIPAHVYSAYRENRDYRDYGK